MAEHSKHFFTKFVSVTTLNHDSMNRVDLQQTNASGLPLDIHIKIP